LIQKERERGEEGVGGDDGTMDLGSMVDVTMTWSSEARRVLPEMTVAATPDLTLRLRQAPRQDRGDSVALGLETASFKMEWVPSFRSGGRRYADTRLEYNHRLHPTVKVRGIHGIGAGEASVLEVSAMPNPGARRFGWMGDRLRRFLKRSTVIAGAELRKERLEEARWRYAHGPRDVITPGWNFVAGKPKCSWDHIGVGGYDDYSVGVRADFASNRAELELGSIANNITLNVGARFDPSAVGIGSSAGRGGGGPYTTRDGPPRGSVGRSSDLFSDFKFKVEVGMPEVLANINARGYYPVL